jgi:osmotically inducible protein OsmC
MTATSIYATTVTATNGRTGSVKSVDGKFDLPLAMPKAMGGAGGDGTNPEQLFAAGYAACFGSALALVARTRKVNIGEVAITARVSLIKDDAGFGLAVDLTGEFAALGQAEAHELMEAAHQVCPYSRATRGNITVTLAP